MTKRRIPEPTDVPPPATPITVVGDVHLTPEEPAVARRFATFLEGVSAKGGTLVLLGDLFDWWVGRKQAVHHGFAKSVLDPLEAVADAGVKLTFLAGNRDYAFDGVEGLDLELWDDVVRTKFGDRTVVLSHGDLLCSDDHGYLQMRRLLRSKVMRWGLTTMPYAWSSWLAQGLRDLSERSQRRSPGARRGIDYGLAEAWMDEYEADALVLGHVHTGVHHELPGPNGTRDVYVLKDWSCASNAVTFDGERMALEGV